MTLHQAQCLHVLLIAKLIIYVYGLGYTLSWGEAYRTAEQAQWDCNQHIGIANSLHCDRLAMDLMLFKDGVYLKDAKDYEFMGTYWKSLDPHCRWGGDIKGLVDADHFSISLDNRI